MSIWPWRSGGHCIIDLKAPELAEAATVTLQRLGRNALSARLIYRALELDPYQPQALLMLSEYYRAKSKVGRPSGDEMFAGIVIEYAGDLRSTLSAEQKRLFDKPRIEIMNMWGFVTPRAGDFEIDFLGYMSFISELAIQVHSVGNGFRIALAKLGIQAGILDGTKGRVSPTYKAWLRSDASALKR